MSGVEQLIDRATAVPVKGYASQVRARPFIKWAGGKRSVIPELLRSMPDNFHAYHEPFVGGGALFYAVESRINKAFLADANADLMIAYRVVQTDVERLIEQLQKHKRLHNKRHYDAVKKRNKMECPVERAARFIYLNKTCFNGLYRVNGKGIFNVPMGKYKNPQIVDEGNLRAASEVLRKAGIKWQSFEKTEPQTGDLVYCDPPYHETYDGYTETRFNGEAQRKLSEYAARWHRAGAKVMISNSDTDTIHKIYNHRH